MGVAFTYLMQPPNRWTFQQPKLKAWVESHCKGLVLNLFAGKTKLDCLEVRVDASNEYDPDIVSDAFEFVLTTGRKFDTVILDPPYSYRKSMEKYNGKTVSSKTKLKNELQRILNPGAVVISLGYDSVGMSKSRRCIKTNICLVCHSGHYHDTIVLVEKYNPAL